MTIRVLLETATAMERSALTGALAGCPDIELIAQRRAGETAGEADIDVVVMPEAAMGELPAAIAAVVDARRIGIVAIGEDGDSGSLYRLERRGWRFAAAGPRTLAEAIRAVATTC